MSDFWKNLLRVRPDFVGQSVFFCPTTTSSLECVVREDATVSPICAPSLRFDSAGKLASAVKCGDLGEHCTCGIDAVRKPPKFKFNKDFFLEPCRKGRVWYLINGSTEASDTGLLQKRIDGSDASSEGMDSPFSGNLREQMPDGCTKISSPPIVPAVSGTAYDEETGASDIPPSFWTRYSGYVSGCTANESSTISPIASSIITKRRPCPGIERARYETVLNQRQWLANGACASPVVVSGERIRSKSCKLSLRPELSLCIECRKASAQLSRIRCRYKKSPFRRSRRLLHCPNRLLSETERKQKMTLLLHRKEEKIRTLQKEAKKRVRCEDELAKYRPVHLANRKAVREITRRLEKESILSSNATCHWNRMQGPCEVNAGTAAALRIHVRKEHLEPQWKGNQLAIGDANEKFMCKWGQCKRKMKSYASLRRHVISHIGSANNEEKVAMLRECMVNASRPPNGRRYSVDTKLRILAQYRSRGMWMRTRATCPLPLPSLGSVLKWKNIGIVDSGVDEEVLKQMKQAAAAKPFLRHGLLTFDEVYVNPQADINNKSLLVFGYANDKPGKLAKTILVFQYIALFSKRKFTVNVAWYGCVGLTAATLDTWLHDVMIGLQRYGFFIHGLAFIDSTWLRNWQRKKEEAAARNQKYEKEDAINDKRRVWDCYLIRYDSDDEEEDTKKFQSAFG